MKKYDNRVISECIFVKQSQRRAVFNIQQKNKVVAFSSRPKNFLTTCLVIFRYRLLTNSITVLYVLYFVLSQIKAK